MVQLDGDKSDPNRKVKNSLQWVLRKSIEFKTSRPDDVRDVDQAHDELRTRRLDSSHGKESKAPFLATSSATTTNLAEEPVTCTVPESRENLRYNTQVSGEAVTSAYEIPQTGQESIQSGDNSQTDQ